MQKVKHPAYDGAWRWWLAARSAATLIGLMLVTLIGLAVLFTYLRQVAAKNNSDSILVGLQILRAMLGQGDFPAEESRIHGMLGTLSACIGALLPAILIGIVFVRIFTIDTFQWRSSLSLCLAAEADPASFRSAHLESSDAVIAARFYKRLTRLTIADISCRAYLRYAVISSVDGSRYSVTVPLDVLGADGSRCSERSWPESAYGTPFTLWIPLDAPLEQGGITSIQGRHVVLDGPSRPRLLVRVCGKVSGLGVDVFDDQWYTLSDRHLQLGRFMPVNIDFSQAPSKWAGWDRFEDVMIMSVFVYGSLIGLADLREILGREPINGSDYVRARLDGFQRRWEVATDNSDDSRSIVYHLHGEQNAPPLKILFPTVLPHPQGSVEGLVVKVNSEVLAVLDQREGNYDRRVVTQSVICQGEFDPGVVYVYTGKPSFVEAARAGISDGSACIRAEYLDKVRRAMDAHDERLRDSFRAECLPGVPIVPLRREPRTRAE